MSTTAERLTAIARDILLAEGAAAVSMRRVATAAGVTPMTIYRHFANREALLTTIADASFAEIAGRWAGRPVTADFDARITELLDDHLDFALGQPHLYAVVFTEPREGARRWPEDFQAGQSPTINLVARALASGIEQGILRDDDIWDWSLIFAALLHGLIQLHQGGRIGLPEPDFRALCHRLVGKVLHGCRR